MKQLLLDLPTKEPRTFDRFVTGRNEELVQRLKNIASGKADDAVQDRFVYLWAASSAGKSHLLEAVRHAAKEGSVRFLTPYSSDIDFEYDPSQSCYLIDDCDNLSQTAQVAAFNLFNQIREHGGYMISASNLPPAQLSLREDLRTRLGWGLIYQIHELTDEEKIEALREIAKARGITIASQIFPYLLTHYRRDMPSLMHILDALDSFSLETKRPITLPLLRELLQQQNGNNE